MAASAERLVTRRRGPFARRAVDVAQLLRLDRPIGILLLLWPVLWALWLAGGGHPDLRVLAIFVAGVVLMRSAGCVINDFADRNIDPQVRRTRARPLAARRISPYEALAVFALLIGGALLLVAQLNRLTLLFSVVGAVLAVTYPFMKRFFALPQFYLGVAFGWGVPMAFAALLGEVPRIGWVLFIVTILWAGVYDTIYAMVDREDDLKAGVKSSAIAFADMDRVIIGVMQGMVLMGLLLVGRSQHLGLAYNLGLTCAAAFFIFQQWLIRDRDPQRCFRAFLNSNYFGMTVFAGLVLEFALRS